MHRDVEKFLSVRRPITGDGMRPGADDERADGRENK